MDTYFRNNIETIKGLILHSLLLPLSWMRHSWVMEGVFVSLVAMDATFLGYWSFFLAVPLTWMQHSWDIEKFRFGNLIAIDATFLGWKFHFGNPVAMYVTFLGYRKFCFGNLVAMHATFLGYWTFFFVGVLQALSVCGRMAKQPLKSVRIPESLELESLWNPGYNFRLLVPGPSTWHDSRRIGNEKGWLEV